MIVDADPFVSLLAQQLVTGRLLDHTSPTPPAAPLVHARRSTLERLDAQIAKTPATSLCGVRLKLIGVIEELEKGQTDIATELAILVSAQQDLAEIESRCDCAVNSGTERRRA